MSVQAQKTLRLEVERENGNAYFKVVQKSGSAVFWQEDDDGQLPVLRRACHAFNAVMAGRDHPQVTHEMLHAAIGAYWDAPGGTEEGVRAAIEAAMTVQRSSERALSKSGD